MKSETGMFDLQENEGKDRTKFENIVVKIWRSLKRKEDTIDAKKLGILG